MAPFVHRMHDPEWLARKLHTLSKDQEAESIVIWDAFITPRILLTRLRQSRNQFTLLSYHHNLVSRQFELIQIIPKPLFAKKNSLILYNMIDMEEESDKLITRYSSRTQFTPVAFKPNFFCTQEFDSWWRNYYTEEVFDVPTFPQHLTEVFTFV